MKGVQGISGQKGVKGRRGPPVSRIVFFLHVTLISHFNVILILFLFKRFCVLICLYSDSIESSNKGKPGIPSQQIPGHHTPPHAQRRGSQNVGKLKQSTLVC